MCRTTTRSRNWSPDWKRRRSTIRSTSHIRADAAALLAKNAEAKIVAGGMTLIPTLKQRLAQPSDLIDLGGIAELKGIKQEGDRLMIGATTTHAEVAASEA